MAKQTDQDTLEAKYRGYVKIGCLLALVAIILIDAIFQSFEASIQIELALITIAAGIEAGHITRRKGKK